MPLDARALLIVAILVTTMLSLLDLLIWRTRRTFPGFGRWAIGHALVAPTLILFALRTILPDFLTVVVANATSLLAAILVWEAAREFRGLRPRIWQSYAAPACAITIMSYFRYVNDNMNARGFIMLGCVGVIGLLAGKTLLTNVPRDREVGMKFTGWLVVLCSLLMIGRGVYYCIQPRTTDLFAWSPPNIVGFIGLSAAITGISCGSLVISGERLLAILRASEHRTARANLELNRLRLGLETAVIERTAELKETQKALLQAQKLESLGRLAGGVAHDFNNFLTVIRAYSQLMAQKLDAASPLRHDVAQMNAACDQAILLTQQLLAFSRRQALEFAVLDLNQVIREMAGMLEHLLGDEVELAIVPSAVVPRVKADLGQMQQVILNLFLNARDAMPDGGRLEVRTALIELSDDDRKRFPDAESGRYVELSIHDTGVGMDEETQAQIFEPFFTTKPVGKGTGLGLASVYGIVKQSGGHIRVETAPGKGTTFRILLPPTNEIVLEDSPEAPVANGQGRILLVDDAAPVRTVLRRILETAEYEVIEAPDAASAMEALCRAPVDLLLTDLQLPGRSGVSLAEEAGHAFPDVKVIVMSGFGDLERLPQDLGVEAALSKPMKPEVLLSAVHRALNRKDHSKTL
ncbi:MAG TPA: ATP-binding protein [Bryobacteraceae bacterium]|nr:ATP-binding protein [Bryobacteraceae bacterium]